MQVSTALEKLKWYLIFKRLSNPLKLFLVAMRLRNISIIVVIFMLLASAAHFAVSANSWNGNEFPGYLTFSNQIVGSYNQPDWNGPKAGLKFHDIADASISIPSQV